MPEVEDNVTKEEKIETTVDMQNLNAKLMEEVYNDPKMSVEKKMQSFSRGVANQVRLSQDTQRRAALAAKLGIKPNGQLKSLTFGEDE